MRSALLPLLLLLLSGLYAQTSIRRINLIPSGPYLESHGRVVCCDGDHDSLPELVFGAGTILPENPLRLEIWEHRPVNRFELVYADTGGWPPRPGITSGRFRPWDAGDIDRDGLTDLVGHNEDWTQSTDSMYNLLTIYESRTTCTYPDSLSWSFRWGTNETHVSSVYLTPDLDRDSSWEIANGTGDTTIGLGIWENRGNNHNELAWHSPWFPCYFLTFGDFDGDGAMEFTGGQYPVTVARCVGDDTYEIVYRDSLYLPNGSDVFSGDVNGDGKPEFLVGYRVVPNNTFYLYLWEGVGVNSYRRVLVDQKTYPTTYGTERASKCGDIDGDGVDEIAWATPQYLYLYKATGPDQFEQIWEWRSDHGLPECMLVNVYDVNHDGYDEIMAGGSGKVSVFAIEAVRVLQPNGRENWQAGETRAVRWQVFTPPRCDSLSVWFTPDNGRTLEPIAHGLPPSPDSIPWWVPDVISDSCRIRVVAYGPGAQIDESDECFRILPAGAEETPGEPVFTTGLTGISPQPVVSDAMVRFELAAPGLVRLSVLDATGRTKATLADEALAPGVHTRLWPARALPAGVYFLEFRTPGCRETRKVVLAK
jgi:hypothetical protein